MVVIAGGGDFLDTLDAGGSLDLSLSEGKSSRFRFCPFGVVFALVVDFLT